MNTNTSKHPAVVNPGEKSTSLPATGEPTQLTKSRGMEIFVTTPESAEPRLSIVSKQRISKNQGRELWRVCLSEDAVARAPLQLAERLNREVVRSKVKDRASKSTFRAEWMAH